MKTKKPQKEFVYILILKFIEDFCHFKLYIHVKNKVIITPLHFKLHNLEQSEGETQSDAIQYMYSIHCNL